jgi:PAS domain S-box-containing protein
MEGTTTVYESEPALEKRMRELECLYNVGSEIRSDENVIAGLNNTTSHLIQAMQFPAIASATIYFNGNEYSVSETPKEKAKSIISSELIVRGQPRGRIEVTYGEDLPFLEEEKRLVEEVALRISKKIERHEMSSELQRYTGKLEDLVEEKTRELENSKKRYEDLFNDAPAPLLISRLNGDIIKANRAFYRLLGYPEDGSVMLNFVTDKLYHDPSMRPVIFKNLEEKGELEGFEVTLMTREGEPIPVIASYIYMDLLGARCVESVYKDIRVRKELERKLIEQNENLERNVLERTMDLENQRNLLIKKNQELMTLTEKLRQSKTRIQVLFKAITDTVTVIDKDFNILLSNHKTIGSRGKCHKKVFGLEEQCEDCMAARVFETKTSITHEKALGEEYYLVATYPVLDAKGNVDQILEISRAITKRKNMERQLLQADKLASLGQLVSGIAHEINNPNTFIRGNIHIIQEAMNDIFPILDKHAKTHPEFKVARLSYDIFRKHIPVLIDDMVEGSNRIKSIVEGLRKFARRDEGFLNENVNINVITEACLRLADNQVRRTADVKVNLATDLPTVVGNSQKLQQVIVNILINASQAIEKSRGTIYVTSSFNDKEVVLQIKDDGKGMDEKTISQIYDPFYTTKRHHGGTGLGLSIAYGIVKEHKGTIEVESRVGMGTTFSIHIPRHAQEGQ